MKDEEPRTRPDLVDNIAARARQGDQGVDKGGAPPHEETAENHPKNRKLRTAPPHTTADAEGKTTQRPTP